MSTDPSAILYYGIDVGGEEFMEDTFDDSAMSDEWSKEHCPAKPQDDNYLRPEWDEWRKKVIAYEATPEYVEMTWFGAENYEHYVIHCPCLKIEVSWDEQHEFEIGHVLGPNPEADKWIEAFCLQFGVPFKLPAWHLAAHYF